MSAVEVLPVGGFGATFSLLLLYIQILQNSDGSSLVQAKENILIMVTFAEQHRSYFILLTLKTVSIHSLPLPFLLILPDKPFATVA